MSAITKYVLIIIGIVLVILICVCLFPQAVLFWIVSGGDPPPQPQITYGEFPFVLEYEINGKTVKVEDVFICEYDGFGSGTNGKFLKWKTRIASTGDEDLLLLSDGNKKVFCSVGSADYYMGERQWGESPKPTLYIEEYENSLTSSSTNPAELEKYNIRIISHQFSDPIENTFRQ